MVGVSLPKEEISPQIVQNAKAKDLLIREELGEAVRTIDLNVMDAETKRQEILETFHSLFSLYESLFDCVTEKGHFARADPLRHPLIFYLGHTAAFFINKLVLAKILQFTERVNPDVESLMAVGVDEMSWDDLLSNDYPWPSLKVVKQFRENVRNVVDQVIRERIHLSSNTVIDWNHPFWPIIMGIEHERIHLETSSVLIRQLNLEYIKSEDEIDTIWKNCSSEWLSNPLEIAQNSFVYVPGKRLRIGRSIASTEREEMPTVYGWDNEYGFHFAEVQSFKANEKLVSNAEWLEFLKDKGYETKTYWSEEGWNWVQYKKASCPLFWIKTGHGENDFLLRNMLSVTKSMPWDWPVEVNALEANAYCRWFSLKNNVFVRLPTEDEWNVMLSENSPYPQISPTQSSAPDCELPLNSNIALQGFSSSCSVSKFKHGKFYDVVGNVWQWTKTPMYPFDGFEVHPLYDDFTSPTFDDQHNLMKGGSWISTGNEATQFSRYAFRRHFYQHAGFRMVMPSGPAPAWEEDFEPKNMANQSLSADVDTSNPYETDSLVNQYCEFHYGPKPAFLNIDNFAVVISRICEKLIRMSTFWDSQRGSLKVLDLGCAVGRSTLELAKTFDQVVGVDFSARFVQVGHQMVENGRIRYRIPIEGSIFAHREAVLGSADIPLDGSDGKSLVDQLFGSFDLTDIPNISDLSKRCMFFQGDACNLASKPVLTGFHCVVAANLIDRLYNPSTFLTSIHSRIVDGGYLVLLSPYTWLSDYTSPEHWIGGKKVDGENVFTKDGLEQILSPWFEMVRIKPADPKFQDPCASTSLGYETDSDGISSFHVPFAIRETHRKFQCTFSECTIWRKKIARV